MWNLAVPDFLLVFDFCIPKHRFNLTYIIEKIKGIAKKFTFEFLGISFFDAYTMENTKIKDIIKDWKEDTIYKDGYGFVFPYHFNDSTLDIDDKYLLAYYGTFTHVNSNDGSIDGSCYASRDKIQTSLGITGKMYSNTRNNLEERNLIIVTRTRKEYKDGSARKANGSTTVQINVLPKAFIENEDSGVQFGNILSYKWGMIPRLIFKQPFLKKVDIVIASYIFANMGTIQDYLLSGYHMRACLTKFNAKTGNRDPLTEYSMKQSFKRLESIFSICELTAEEYKNFNLNKGKPADYNCGDMYRIKVKNSKTNNYALNIPCSKKFLPEEDLQNVDNLKFLPEEDLPLEDLPDGKLPEEDLPPINNITNNQFNSINNINSLTILDHQSTVPADQDDQGVVTESENKDFHEELKKRLGFYTAKQELVFRYNNGEIDDIKKEALKQRLWMIYLNLIILAREDKSIEEYCYAWNILSFLFHRSFNTNIDNIKSYILSVIKNEISNGTFLEAPVEDFNEYVPIIDGYRMSDEGKSQRPLYVSEYNHGIQFDAAAFDQDVISYFEQFGILNTRAILLNENAKSRFADLMLMDLSLKDYEQIKYCFGKEQAEKAVKRYRDIWEYELLSGMKELDGVPVFTDQLIKWLAPLIMIEGGEIKTKNSLAGRCISLYLKKDLNEVACPTNFFSSLIIREIKDFDSSFVGKDLGDPSRIQPAFVIKNSQAKQNALSRYL